MTARPWTIYGLAEPEGRPEPGLIRYVGKTSRKPQMRFSEHLKGSTRHHTYLGKWLRKLLASRLKPELIILEQGIGAGADESERWHIGWWQYSSQLTNHFAGGEGGALLEGASGEVTREKLRNAGKREETIAHLRTLHADSDYCHKRNEQLKALRADPAFREKMRSAAKARWNDPAYRAKNEAHLREIRRKQSENPTLRKMRVEQLKAQWSDPAYRQRMLENLRRLHADPNLRQKRIEVLIAGNKRRAAEARNKPKPGAKTLPEETIISDMVCGACGQTVPALESSQTATAACRH